MASPVALGDDALLGQHGAVGDRALDVLCGEALVEADGGVDGFHERTRRGREPTAPHGVGRRFEVSCDTVFTRWS